MKEWNEIRKPYKIVEIFGILIMVGCLLTGICCDWNVLVKNHVWVAVKDIDAFSLTILQIQATVGTLIVAIIALITGSISDSYMGVSISDFYLNIKPWKLTQKILIFILLGLCLAETVFHSLKLYNIVFYLFVATLVTILISIMEIYSAFQGRNKQNQEIEAYIHYILERSPAYETKRNLYQRFVLDWEKQLDSQDKQSYEKYHEIFEKCMLAMWEYGTVEGLQVIEQQCYSMAYGLLWSEKATVKERGVEFIQDVYDFLWKVIYNGIKEKEVPLDGYKKEFSFFTEICNELVQNMDELSIENMEKRMKFGNLMDSIQRVAIWFSCGEEEKEEVKNNGYKRYQYNFSSEMNELNSFAKYIGYYLGKQQNKNNTINQRIWANVLNGWGLFSSYNIPQERAEDFLKAKVSAYFSYCYGMLVNGQENVVKQGLYLTGMRRIVKLDNRYQALLYIAVHCYIYYLAVRENEDCVSAVIRQSARNIWEDKNVKGAFEEFLNMLAENSEWLNQDIPDQIYGIVDQYELFPQYESVKSMIIEYVVSDFYLFLILFMEHEFFLPELLNRNIDERKAFRYVSDGNEKQTKDMLKALFKMIFTGSKTEEQVGIEVDLMYDKLEKTVKEKQKERYIELAKEAQKNYEANVREEEVCEEIKKDVIRKIKEKFAPILVEEDKKNGEIRINLLNLTDYTNSVGAKSIDGYYSHIDGMFLHGIEDFLYKRKVLEPKKRFDDFSDDKEFMEYLSANNMHLLMGSRFIMKNEDYRMGAEYKRFLEDYETIYTAVINYGMALKKDAVQVCLHHVNVSIHSPGIKDEDTQYDEKTGKYEYSIINGLPISFEERELRDFLYNNRKVINVTARVSIQVNEKPVGTIFTGRKRR